MAKSMMTAADSWGRIGGWYQPLVDKLVNSGFLQVWLWYVKSVLPHSLLRSCRDNLWIIFWVPALFFYVPLKRTVYCFWAAAEEKRPPIGWPIVFPSAIAGAPISISIDTFGRLSERVLNSHHSKHWLAECSRKEELIVEIQSQDFSLVHHGRDHLHWLWIEININESSSTNACLSKMRQVLMKVDEGRLM